MLDPRDLASALDRISARLDQIDHKLESLSSTRHKSIEWIAQISEQVQSLDSFREEVRMSLEPLFVKLEGIDETLRIMRHATSDVSRRIESIEGQRRKVG
jgi:chromosome segregation ATPase